MKELTIAHIPPVDAQPARVRVSYRAEPSAQPTHREAPFTFALTPDQRRDLQWYLEEYLIYPWGEFRTRAARVEAMLPQIGAALFEAVFSTRELSSIYARAANDLGLTDIVIHAADPAGIAIPWELLRDPTRGDYGDLAQLARTFTRSQPDLATDPAPPPAGDTFNILMVIARPGGAADVAFQSVARPMLELFRPHRDRIRLDVLRPPTFEELRRALDQRPGHYHVVHFDGHGVFPEGGAGGGARFYGEGGAAQGLLAFEGEDGEPRHVTGAELGALLARSKVPAVILNACQSGMTRPESLYPSLGNQLLAAGARGVVAMTYSVYVQSAVRFMKNLYEALINGEELARATTLARADLRAHPRRSSGIGDVPLQDWLVPVLFQSAPVQVAAPPAGKGAPLTLNLAALSDRQAEAGAEIDCPEPPAYGFVGRDDVLLELERAYQTETIVLLQGMAGNGKTEAAMGFARWRAETGGLAGPIFFTRFEHHLPLIHVLDRIGQTFAPLIKQQLGTEWHLLDEAQRRTLAVAILRQIPCLLIWDNFEPVAGFPAGDKHPERSVLPQEGAESKDAWRPDERQALRDFLRDLGGGATKVLITSRRNEPWLGPIYGRVQLDGLRLTEAQELAVRVLRRTLTAAELRALPDYLPLLVFLQGNPLAIQVILPELKRRPPAALLADLRAGSAALPDDDREQGRTRSLAASLSYRFDAQDPALRVRLAPLALFQGFVNAAILANISLAEGAPAKIAGRKADAWVGDLDCSAEMGLLRNIGEGFYTVHPALPWYFHDLMQAAFGPQRAWFERTFARVYGGYASYLDDLFKTNAQFAVELLGTEEANLRHALALARRDGEYDAIQGILYGLNQLLDLQGRWVEWRRLVEELEAETAGPDGAPLSGRERLWRALLGHRALISFRSRDWAGAKELLLRLKDHYERAGDDKNVAAMLHDLGMTAQERRQWDEAKRWYHEGLAIWERIGDERGQASTLHQLGNITQERRQWDEAERWYRKSLAIWERIGDERGQARTLHQLGVNAQERRQWDEAERWCRASLAVKERIGDTRGQAMTLHQLGMVAQEREQWDEAERWYRASLAIDERIGDDGGQAQSLHQLGRIAEGRRLWEEAERWHRGSLAIKERIGDDGGQAQSLHQLGNIAYQRRQWDEAERWYRASLAIEERIGDEHGQALTMGQLAYLAEQQGRIGQARELFMRAEAIFERVNDPYHLEVTRENLRLLDELESRAT